ncbi:pseudouridine synthase [Gymnopus androsaceus JB14]|uniref:21S rRNA pseudouridine(2819) synthase n=1 Tax=Gymnopus androsaceus JB14 TaxID=1447944 RepID=A0A6A4HMX3_9AGAR|nr:pseudouridine synthase [Gymnopus androsaceus JB14]
MNLRILFRNSLVLESNKILYIDRAFCVVNKPSNFVTQYPADGHSDAVAELVGHTPSLAHPTKLYPVHRLDKGTTGCMVFARSSAQAEAFSHQLRQRTTQKIYHALVDSSSSPPLNREFNSGSIHVGMSLKNGRPHVSSSESAKDTSTDWQVVGCAAHQANISLIRLQLHTGMKHQLRVHMSDVLQAPIFGDLQHTRMRNSVAFHGFPIPNDRLFLHSSAISFHRFRRTGKQKRLNVTVCAPLPQDFLELCIRVGIKVPPHLVKGGLLLDGQPIREIPDLDGMWVSPENS